MVIYPTGNMALGPRNPVQQSHKSQIKLPTKVTRAELYTLADFLKVICFAETKIKSTEVCAEKCEKYQKTHN